MSKIEISVLEGVPREIAVMAALEVVMACFYFEPEDVFSRESMKSDLEKRHIAQYFYSKYAPELTGIRFATESGAKAGT